MGLLKLSESCDWSLAPGTGHQVDEEGDQGVGLALEPGSAIDSVAAHLAHHDLAGSLADALLPHHLAAPGALLALVAVVEGAGTVVVHAAGKHLGPGEINCGQNFGGQSRAILG